MKTYRTKKSLLLLLIFALIFSFSACSSSEEEDPGEEKTTVTASEKDSINTFLNQYNLDAEYPVSDESISEVTDTSVEFDIEDINVRLTTIDDEHLTALLVFNDPESAALDAVVRDLIIAFNPDLSYDEISDMLSAFRDGSETAYQFEGLECDYAQGDGGVYQLTIQQTD